MEELKIRSTQTNFLVSKGACYRFINMEFM
jgi:hypothetical protein